MLTTDQVLGKGRYRIISSFTHDETGGLYEAYDTVSNSNVVLRETVGSNGGVMTPSQLDEINNAFAGEAETLKEVRHESLLSVQDYFSEIDRHYLVMEQIDGFDLTRFLHPEENSPAVGDLIKWFDQILAALDYLHMLPEPLVHRDIRPANIRITSSFQVKLLTSGLSRGDVIMASAGHLEDSTVLNYRPLEQLWGGLDPASQKVISNSYDDRSRRILMQPLDSRSDIYSVGATLYHVFTRTLPSDALERSIEMLDGNSDPLVPPAELNDAIPEAISEVIMKSMELRREHRYDSAAIMRQVLSSTWQRVQSAKAADPKPRVSPDPLAVAEPTETVVDLKKAKLEDAPKPPAHEPPTKLESKPFVDKSDNIQVKSEEPLESIEDLLLEVEPVKSADDDFEWSVEVSEQPSRKGAEVSSYSAVEHEIDFGLSAPRSSNLKFVAAGGAALVIVVAVFGWLFMGGSAPAEQPKAQVPEVQQPSQPEQQSVSTFSDQNSSNANEAPFISETVTVDGKTETKQATKEKKPTPAPTKTPEKKKVTVDDLINDN